MNNTSLNQSTSFNGKLILEAYKQTEIRAEIKSGWATPNQRSCLKGLKVLFDARLSDNVLVPAGSTAFIKEESLHTQPWAKNKLKCDSLTEEFIIVNMNEVEYVEPPHGGAA